LFFLFFHFLSFSILVVGFIESLYILLDMYCDPSLSDRLEQTMGKEAMDMISGRFENLIDIVAILLHEVFRNKSTNAEIKQVIIFFLFLK